MLLCPPASAEQLDAASAPISVGPLDIVTRRCVDESKRRRGRVIASALSCLRFYAFEPSLERDEQRDFGVIWLQTNLNAKRRWCARVVKADIILPDGVTIVSGTPKDKNADEARTVRAKIKTDKELAIDVVGAVRARFLLYPRGLETSYRDAGQKLRLVWRGRERSKLGFAQGLELAWRRQAPPSLFSSSLRYELRRQRRC